MSTIPEVLTAVHCDMSVFAFSLITNKCVLDEDEEGPNHEEVIEAANENKESLSSFVTRFACHASVAQQRSLILGHFSEWSKASQQICPTTTQSTSPTVATKTNVNEISVFCILRKMS